MVSVDHVSEVLGGKRERSSEFGEEQDACRYLGCLLLSGRAHDDALVNLGRRNEDCEMKTRLSVNCRFAESSSHTVVG